MFFKFFEGFKFVVNFNVKELLKKFCVRYEDVISLYFFVNKICIYFMGYLIIAKRGVCRDIFFVLLRFDVLFGFVVVRFVLFSVVYLNYF